MFVFMKSRTSLKLGHFGSKTTSPGQTLEKLNVCSRDQIFGLIPMKIVQSFCFDETLYIFNMGHIRSQTRSLGQTIEDPMLVTEWL